MMRKAWCQLCGAETWQAHGHLEPVLLDTEPGAATDRVSVVTSTAAGKARQTFWRHRCKEIKYPKQKPHDAANAARRAVGLDPLAERSDSA